MAFDRAAIRARAAAAVQKPVPVTLPEIGEVWVRPLTGGDWVEKHAAIAKLREAGHEVTASLAMAIGLAQNLCGPEGEQIFDPSNLDDLKLIAALPVDTVVAALLEAKDEGSEKKDSLQKRST